MKEVRCFIMIVLMITFVVGCNRTPAPEPAREARESPHTGKCPKIEGSYFSTDKSEITKGESIELRWKVPYEYMRGLRIEGMETGSAPLIENFKSSSSNSPIKPMEPPQFYEETVPNVKPEQTTTYILKAPGPEGCTPLELPATVTVR